MSKPKTIQSIIKLVIKAGQAKPAPPVGPALGQAGLNLMSFCKDFNAKTADMMVGATRVKQFKYPSSGYIHRALPRRIHRHKTLTHLPSRKYTHACNTVPRMSVTHNGTSLQSLCRVVKRTAHTDTMMYYLESDDSSRLPCAPQEGVPVPVSITAYTDKTFTYVRFLTAHNPYLPLALHLLYFWLRA